ncbi:MAG TPA: VOC family protein [Pyrinomonadaceae bacterium]
MAIEITYLTPLIQVFNMPRSLAFYRDLLGFEVVSDSGEVPPGCCVTYIEGKWRRP